MASTTPLISFDIFQPFKKSIECYDKYYLLDHEIEPLKKNGCIYSIIEIILFAPIFLHSTFNWYNYYIFPLILILLKFMCKLIRKVIYVLINAFCESRTYNYVEPINRNNNGRHHYRY